MDRTELLLQNNMNEKHAFVFKKVADLKNIGDLDGVFKEIEKAAIEGKYIVNLKEELVEAQRDTLHSLGFDTYNYEEDDDEEYADGFRSCIEWSDASDPNEDDD